MTDTLWVLLCAALVFLMQAGFLCLETGLTRSKNNINVAVKNLSDFGLSSLLYWGVGFGIMFGLSRSGLFGASFFFLDFATNPTVAVFFIFQVMFCGTATTILSGGVAERMRFGSYLVAVALISVLIFPVFGHWAWNGMAVGASNGWLGARGFVDFAGSSVVHSVGGWVTLALLLLIGPRLGRFPKDGPPQMIPGASMPLAGLGVLLLWFGWFGFNGGSTLALNDQVPSVLGNTLIAGSAGMLAGLGAGFWRHHQVNVGLIFNGTLAGLVAITAGASVVSTSTAVFIGFIGGVAAFMVEELLVRLRIDDAVGAVPVHLGAGIWGTLAVGLFGQAALLGTGLTRWQQTGVQLLGIVVCFAWAFGLSYAILWLVNRFYTLRVSAYGEHIGLNVSEHGASTEILNLFSVMDLQSKSGDLSLRAPVEPFTEVGQIAERYNQVMERLEEVVARTDAIVNTASDGIITFSTNRHIIKSVNPAAERIFAYTASQLLERPFAKLIASDGNQFPLDHIILNKTYHEISGRRQNGVAFPLEIAITQSESGRETFYVALIRDISLRKEGERALATARDQALEASRLKSEFLAIVGHELRTPLNAIMGIAELVETGIYGDVSDKQRQALQRIINGSERLTHLVNEVLDQAQLEAGTLKIAVKPFSAQTILEQIEFTMGVLAIARGLTLTTGISDDFPPVLYGDPGRINQILINLVGNALKFTEKGGVDVSLSRFDPHTWMIKVTDTGPGLSQESQEYIFEAFRQVENPLTREHGGIGLGLSITKQLAMLMGGDVLVESKVSQGSCFTVLLPLVEEFAEAL